MTFNINRNDNHLSISFSASLDNVDRAADETKMVLISLGLERHLFGVLLCLREALNNSVISGCNRDQEKTVTYHLKLENRRLVLEVEDEGEGFDWKHQKEKEPTALEESGRGLRIMEQYFETVRYNEKGNRLVLKKNV